MDFRVWEVEPTVLSVKQQVVQILFSRETD